jgi:hypothetical protein
LCRTGFSRPIVDLSEGGRQVRLARPLDLPQRFVVEFNDTAYLCTLDPGIGEKGLPAAACSLDD